LDSGDQGDHLDDKYETIRVKDYLREKYDYEEKKNLFYFLD